MNFPSLVFEALRESWTEPVRGWLTNFKSVTYSFRELAQRLHSVCRASCASLSHGASVMLSQPKRDEVTLSQTYKAGSSMNKAVSMTLGYPPVLPGIQAHHAPDLAQLSTAFLRHQGNVEHP